MSSFASQDSLSVEHDKPSVSPRVSILFDPDIISHLAKVSAAAIEEEEVVRPEDNATPIESIIRAEIEEKINRYNQQNEFQICLFKHNMAISALKAKRYNNNRT
ncbi:uncharacterized protein TRIADDRAFT_62143 [Trichoplax adhaerens]|uniref:Uncharacterized protein n=1 Tax=Trichoplax adhaerens TaxID=10228 RepID=B3SCY7_TRIAD|nr:predicted protein [Trichoplax adhaerens]EDV19426.1 predicted protein [Trichoplax adhaerens]|eukprot:XP_002118115.1 predicted protein [Trichoplax adhaerens]